jgi:hypothetical protein
MAAVLIGPHHQNNNNNVRFGQSSYIGFQISEDWFSYKFYHKFITIIMIVFGITYHCLNLHVFPGGILALPAFFYLFKFSPIFCFSQILGETLRQ